MLAARPWTCAAKAVSNAEKLAVLAEEFGEAAKEVVEETIARSRRSTFDGGGDLVEAARANLRTELIQVAAVAVAWAESLER